MSSADGGGAGPAAGAAGVSGTAAGAAAAAAVAARVAGEVGELLLELRVDPPPGGPQAVRDAADRAADDLAHLLLAQLAPGDAVLSEEAPDDLRRLTQPRLWIVDPLDGTREYGIPGRTDWAVHVALWTAADGLVAGAVALPGMGVVLDSGSVPRLGPLPPDRPVRVAVSRSRPPAVASAVAAALASSVASSVASSATGSAGGRPGPELVPMGSAGAKTAAVVREEVDLYLETGGLHEWDTAAPVAVALAAGLAVVAPDGSPVLFNRPDLHQDGLVVCRPELLATVLAALAPARPA